MSSRATLAGVPMSRLRRGYARRPSTSALRADDALLADLGAVEQRGVHADEAAVADHGAVDDGAVADRAAAADHDRRARLGVDDDTVLDARLRGDR